MEKGLFSLPYPEWTAGYTILRTSNPPLEGSAGREGADLDRLEVALVEEIKERQSLRLRGLIARDRVDPGQWLKSACYQIILSWYACDFDCEIDARIEKHNRFVKGEKKERDIFQRGIVGLFATDAKVIPDTHRSRLADPMWYAFRHYIPPVWLNEFNRKYPGHRAHRADWRQYIEPELEDWVTEQRVASQYRGCPLDAFRATYPPHLEDRVEAAVRKADLTACNRRSSTSAGSKSPGEE